MWLVAVFVCVGWMMSLCLHEFGHAITAYWGGDTSVKDKGYLTLNPFKYTDPGISLLVPLLFLLLGGFALPGGAVYIETSKLRSRWWNSAVSAAGCVAEFLLVLALTGVFHATWNPEAASDNLVYMALMVSLVYVIFLNIYVIFINLLPIPGLDGYGIIQPWVPKSINQKLEKFSSYGFWILIAVLWFYPPFGLGLRSLSDSIITLLQIPTSLVDIGASLFRTHAQYIVLGLIAILWLFRDKRKDLYKRGTRLISENKYEKAIETFDRAIEKEPGNYRAWLMRGYALYCLGHYNDALLSYNQALEFKLDSDVWYYKGLVFGEINELDEELSCYNKVLEIQPEHIEALCNRGNLYLNQGDNLLALADFNKAISLNTNYAFAWRQKGDTLSKLERYEETISAYQQVMRLQPRSNVWVELVNLLDKTQQYEKVIAVYDQKLRLQPEATVFNRRGLILKKLGNPEEAKVSFEQALKISEKTLKHQPQDAGACFEKGLAYQNLQKYTQAISAYNQAIKIEAKHAQAWYNLACCYALQHNPELAVENLRISIDIDRTHLITAKTDPDFDTIRDSSLFQTLLLS
jgi:tetratricopeptide (TPR) repeat protein